MRKVSFLTAISVINKSGSLCWNSTGNLTTLHQTILAFLPLNTLVILAIQLLTILTILPILSLTILALLLSLTPTWLSVLTARASIPT